MHALASRNKNTQKIHKKQSQSLYLFQSLLSSAPAYFYQIDLLFISIPFLLYISAIEF